MKEAEVILARSAGFCFGVHRAVDTVYERTGMENVYTYGPIIHNDEVVKDLESKGVKAISDVAQLDGIDNATVIIRSHGVSKNVYESIKTKNYEVVDATCPFVLKIHRIVEQESIYSSGRLYFSWVTAQSDGALSSIPTLTILWGAMCIPNIFLASFCSAVVLKAM